MNLASIWRELEADAPTGRRGRLERLLFEDSAIDLFATVQLRPPPNRNRRALELVVANTLSNDLDLPASTRLVDVLMEARTSSTVGIVLALEEPGAEDLFSALCGDVARAASLTTDQRSALSVFCGRFERWRRLLQGNATGLAPSRQRGLYGELVTLLDQLAPVIGIDEAILAWLGPDGAPRDFEVHNIGIETKATATTEPQVVAIHGERQLDDTGLRALSLVHHSLEIVRDGRDTLPALVARVRDTAVGTPSAGIFEDRLMQSGYADIHAAFYRRAGYILRETTLFEVRDGFPRIVEADLPDGLGRVSYTLAIDACRQFRQAADALTVLLGGAE